MDLETIAALKRVEQAKDAMWQALEYGAREYAEGNGRAKPIVDRHFTAGNEQRYGWAPLSRGYFLQKQGQVKALHGLMKAKGRPQSKLDPAASFQSSTGTLTGIGKGKNLPMLVRSGALREAVTSRNHTITVDRNRGVVTVVFMNLPKYALYHHEGSGRLPKRSPVDPNEEDRQQVVATVKDRIDLLTGQLANGRGTNPGRFKTG